uniref:Uncharacterized protein n=1 Tax=Anopheles farauti TaxID=69004 RepID=A0A182QPF6_9DIPT
MNAASISSENMRFELMDRMFKELGTVNVPVLQVHEVDVTPVPLLGRFVLITAFNVQLLGGEIRLETPTVVFLAVDDHFRFLYRDRPLFAQIAHIRLGELCVPLVQELRVLVHPHLGHALEVPDHEVNAARIAERCVATVDVAHARTGRIDEPATALPDFEAQLVLLPAPDVQPLVVASELPEELGTDGEQAARHDGTVEGFCRIVQIAGQQRQAFVVELPVERSPFAFILRAILEGVVCDHVDEGTDARSLCQSILSPATLRGIAKKSSSGAYRYTSVRLKLSKLSYLWMISSTVMMQQHSTNSSFTISSPSTDCGV